METIGLRELRQNASALVRRAEAGEEITITVAGRPSARLAPLQPARWRTWAEVSDLWRGVDDPDWAEDRELIDQELLAPQDRE